MCFSNKIINNHDTIPHKNKYFIVGDRHPIHTITFNLYIQYKLYIIYSFIY